MNRVVYKIIASVLILSTLVATPGVLALFAPASLFAAPKAQAAINEKINYQGKLTNSSSVAVADGTYHMMFRLYTSATAATTTNIWEEDRSTATGDRITVTNGLFSVMLGSSTALTSINFSQTLYLGVEVGGSGSSPSWDGEMSPRKVFGAVPAAFVAESVDGGTIDNVSRSTTTSATTTNLFSTTASSTNLFSTNANLGFITGGRSTTTEATTTNIFSTTASSTNLYSTNA
ncbi:hypothetical protein EPN83_02985, partial [Patescibacteria group bacterium]